MVDAMIREIAMQKTYLNGEPLDTIYFGGGTPSILEHAQLAQLIDAVHKHHAINHHPEITLEANPDDLSEEKLSVLHQLGVNRLSIGIQSFDDEVLRFLNRAHDAQEAVHCVERARRVDFNNISIDLIFSIPGTSEAVLENDIKTGLSLAPEHISVYSLSIEQTTVFGNWYARGKLQITDDDESARQFEFIINQLEQNGYEQYEISNFSIADHYSRHNSSYWKNAHYLGIGPGAHSYNGVSRQFNLPHNPNYLKSMAKGVVPFEVEALDATAKTNEYLLTTLRTKWGSDLDKLRQRFGYELLNERAADIEKLILNGLVRIEGNKMFLTKKGVFLADEVIRQLFRY
jgi:oxygen-independent coproporphyrinogen-3 oxidase